MSDAYVGELIAQPSGAILRADLTSTDLQTVWGRFWQARAQQFQHLLLGSRLFSPTHPSSPSPLVGVQPKHGVTALIWAAVGLLVAVQLDWALARALTADLESATKPATVVSPGAIAPSPASPSPANPFANLQP
ncbi:MAG: hypothetical protein HC881_06485 [Leptolyngbyaceae cyanobacterium SL_7_1]|nr:hypothetical protein [Leptolyngbyaceae cyanobacterium SL_7_1]